MASRCPAIFSGTSGQSGAVRIEKVGAVKHDREQCARNTPKRYGILTIED
jgi:hypothetical protein